LLLRDNMKALRLTGWGRPAELCDVEVPEPLAGQVVVKIAGSGACHSDLHLMDWPAGTLAWKLPFTLGHENAGWVDAVGPGVSGLHRGDAVIVHGAWGCGRCRPCRLGRENYCERAAQLVVSGGGLGADGGMAEYMLVPSVRLLVPLGDLDPVQAAPLADAALTPYHAIANARDRLQPGAYVVVIGCGGLGQMGIQLVRATTGARVIAVDRDDRKLELVRRLGADVVIRSDDRMVDTIRRATGSLGAELVLDMVGSDATLAAGARALRAEGRLVVVGLGLGTLPFSFFALPYGVEVATSYWGTATELMELVVLARAGRIRMDIETYSLDRALEAYDRLRRGEIRGRAVITPH
jgi:propanol-preferring alcohol dehydrogenase